jgi:hypothetical protein
LPRLHGRAELEHLQLVNSMGFDATAQAVRELRRGAACEECSSRRAPTTPSSSPHDARGPSTASPHRPLRHGRGRPPHGLGQHCRSSSGRPPPRPRDASRLRSGPRFRRSRHRRSCARRPPSSRSWLWPGACARASACATGGEP